MQLSSVTDSARKSKKCITISVVMFLIASFCAYDAWSITQGGGITMMAGNKFSKNSLDDSLEMCKSVNSSVYKNSFLGGMCQKMEMMKQKRDAEVVGFGLTVIAGVIFLGFGVRFRLHQKKIESCR